MKKFLLSLALLCFGMLLQAQVVLEDFESGAPTQSWAIFNNAVLSTVANPDQGAGNNSVFVGSVTNPAPNDFSFVLATLSGPVDFSTAGLAKLRVWSPIAPCEVLLKFEGTGTPVEQFVTINTANQWVDLTFNMTAGAANPTGLTKCLVAFNPFVIATGETFYFDDLRTATATTCFEDFENVSLPWNALDGTFEGPVANPGPNSVNSSTSCGKYIKSPDTGFSLLLADNGPVAFDLSVNNLFEMDVYATAATKVMLKLEGTGTPIEVTKNIGLVNQWQRYSFDLSAAAGNTGLTKMIIFFDPGTSGSSDTYYFDNICAKPNPCQGATVVPFMVDDFECNRNATYVNGWDSLTVVANPAPIGANTSASVGRYADPQGEEWAALLIDNGDPINLSTNNQLRLKVRANVAAPILFKLEGGASPAVEVAQSIPAANTWTDIVVDFSAQSAANHTKLVMFFNPGQLPGVGDVYFIDDIRWGIVETTVVENFENGAALPWQPLDNSAVLHGSFAVINNPDATGINTSAKVGRYTKGSSPFSTVEAVAPGIINLAGKPQYNLDIWAPAGATNVIMQLESLSGGNKEVSRSISANEEWINVSFDFTPHQNLTDFVAMRLLFEPGQAQSGTIFYYDNLTQGPSTIDPCENVVAIPNIIDDYECQRNYAYGAGAAQLSVVENPNVSVVNNSPKVGKFAANAGSSFQALCAEIPGGAALAVFNQLEVTVLAPSAIPVLLKLEGGSSPAVETFVNYTTEGQWQKLSADFSAQATMNHTRACIFLNAGVEPATAIDYHIDNFRFAQAPFYNCIANFEAPGFTPVVWKYFPDDNSGDFELVDNPAPSVDNNSLKVGKAVEKATGGQPWQGMYTDLPAPIRFGNNKLITMKVWSPQVATVTMKLENPALVGAPGSSGDNTVANTLANQWQTLIWDFSVSPNPIPDNGDYQRITLIWDINNIPASDVIYYFDDISIDNATCGNTSTNESAVITPLTVVPNPTTDMVRIDNLSDAVTLVISDVAGRRLALLNTGNDTSVSFSTAQFAPGLYIVTGYNNAGQTVAQARLMKI